MDDRSTYIVPVGQMLDQQGKLKYMPEDHYDMVYNPKNASTLMKQLQKYKRNPIVDEIKIDAMTSSQINFRNMDGSELMDDKSY